MRSLSTSSQVPGRTSGGPPSVAVHGSTADPDVVEMSAVGGADLYIVDLEHGTASDADCAAAVRAGDAFGIPVAIRLTTRTLGRVGRLLDSGAAGAIMADIRSASDCTAGADCTFRPPAGRRGTGASRDNAYGSPAAAPRALPAVAGPPGRPLFGVQIESAEGLSQLDEILGAAPVGMVMVGTRDLAIELGHDGDFTNAEVVAATRRVADAAHRRGIAFAQMVRLADQVERALRLEPEWLLVPLAAVLRTGLQAFSERPDPS